MNVYNKNTYRENKISNFHKVDIKTNYKDYLF